ncbi:unnamed protein product [Rotaria socialis]|uniref:ATP synthase-coupling factor 6, mitochondrial n=1 Tax=Rotaria socialis TaxID=392032 RepID=A0A819YAQ6_9BILA|nr:unnamed protein product [Rotaria socialis]CAF3429849.1 unnamed protein product [Rotaria socialis]CAF3457508.1 unnamed protein product [Rotaria socialis]CAF3586076.1 unnamed protein product [Rotaria socialis]CAF3750803.1 unnamed protein product [Rotaria socialis]
MLNRCITSPLRNSYGLIVARHLSLSAPLAQSKQQATDPIQQLFVNKIRDYYDKRKQTKDGLVDATPDVRKSLEDTLNKLKHSFGAETEDLLSVPKLEFKEPQLEAVIDKQVKEVVKKPVVLSQEDIKKYSGSYGSWSQENQPKKQEQKTLDQR